MPQPVALLFTISFVLFVFRWDRARTFPETNGASKLPLIWFFMECSRGIAGWMMIFGVSSLGSITYEDGNPADRVYYLIMIGLGINVLRARRVRIVELIRENAWLLVFLGYCLLAIIWSDYPFVSAKRWIKVLGCPVMALIVLTEPNPKQAVILLFKRAAFILIPVSILFIKYYPEWGRGFDTWTGLAFNMGIALNKNMLGMNCLTLGFFFIWHTLCTWKEPRGRARNEELGLCAFFLTANLWLFIQSDSKTPLMALVLGVLVLLLCGSRFGGKKAGGVFLVGVVGYFIADSTFNIFETVLGWLGRDATLTDRTLLWESLLEVPINPILGTGFDSFWLGERRELMWDLWSFQPNQAHNGYLETYLNLGIIGLALLIVFLWSSYWEANRRIKWDFEWGRFCLGFLVALIVYNWTEAGFKLVSPIMLILFLVSLRVPVSSRVPAGWSERPPLDQRRQHGAAREYTTVQK